MDLDATYLYVNTAQLLKAHSGSCLTITKGPRTLIENNLLLQIVVFSLIIVTANEYGELVELKKCIL